MKKRGICIGLLFALSVGLYLPSTRFDFVMLDDYTHLHENTHLNPPTAKKILSLWQKPYQGLYIPLTYTFWAGLKLMGGQELSPVRFHYTNTLVHAATTVVVFLLLGALGLKTFPAFLGALLFSWHPLQVESVAWISGFKDVGSGFFFFLSLFFFLRAIHANRSVGPLGPRNDGDLQFGKRGYLGALLCAGAAYLCKPSTIVLTPLLFFILVSLLKYPWRQALRVSIAPALLALPILYLTRSAQPETQMLYVAPLWSRPLIACDTLLFYLSKLFFPLGLAPDYSRSPQALLHHVWGYLSWIGVGILLVWLTRRDRRWAQGVVLFAIPLLPVLGLVPFFFQFFSTVADRYAYLSLFGASWLVATLIQNSRTHRLLPGLAMLTLAYGYPTFRQIPVWRNDETLFSHTVKVNPRSLMGRNNLGSILEKQGKVPEAALQFYEATRIAPESPPALYNLGRTLGLLGRYEEAAWPLEKLVKVAPGLADGHYVLGYVLLKQKNYERAKIHLSYATELNPLDARAHYHLGQLFLAEGKPRLAWQSFQQALSLNPNHTEAKSAGEIALRQWKRPAS